MPPPVAARRPFVTTSELMHRAKKLTQSVTGIGRTVESVTDAADLRAFWRAVLVACLAHLDSPDEDNADA